ncbi:MAG: hypothetical protein ACI8RT_000311, partial [Candidatus Azotimanducaceae bacterium]
MYSPWYASVFFKLPVQIFIGLLVCGNVFAQVQH